MKVAMPIWNDRVSGAFDFAQRILLVDIENGRETGRSEISLPPESDPEKANRLKALEAEVLICGAISRSLAFQIAASGIRVLPYVAGHVDEILKAYLTGELIQPQFTLPGCWPGARRGFRRRRRSPRNRR